MKKHTDRATNVKSVNGEKIAAQVAGQRMVLGIDVAKDDFFAVLMKAERSVMETIKWVHPEQTRALAEPLLHDLPADRLEVVMEPSGTYGDALRRDLSE